MKYNPAKHHRQPLRLKSYDYSQVGFYFVTICTQDRQLLFGEINDTVVTLNAIGKMIDWEWKQIPHRYACIDLDEYIIMPNHLHGILEIINDQSIQSVTLFDCIGSFKSITTNRYIKNVNEHHCPPFSERIWQLRYHDRIIRNEKELNQIRQYILDNPLNWSIDENNPLNQSP